MSAAIFTLRWREHWGTIEDVGVACVEEAAHEPVEEVPLPENAGHPRVVVRPITCHTVTRRQHTSR